MILRAGATVTKGRVREGRAVLSAREASRVVMGIVSRGLAEGEGGGKGASVRRRGGVGTSTTRRIC